MSASNCCCGGCGCRSCNYNIILPSEAPAVLSFQNINVGGVGVLDSAVQPVINFRGVSSANAMLTATLDNVNHNILLTVDSTAIAAALPAATTTQVGVLETATDAEAIAKAATDKIVTPSNFAAMAASSTFAGLIEIATNAETQAGASALLAVTPAGLLSVTALLKGTVTFADAVARAALVPGFEGQFGYQLDTNNPYVARGVGAGNWNNVFSFGTTNVVPAATITDITFGVAAETTYTGGLHEFTTGIFRITSSAFDLNSVEVQTAGVALPSDSVVITTGTPGDISTKLISEFLSTDQVQTGYTNFANGVVLRTCDTTTVTLPQLAQIVGTLINDLKALNVPAT